MGILLDKGKMEILEVLPLKLFKFHYDGDMEKLSNWLIRENNRSHKEYGCPPNMVARGMPYMVMDWSVPEFKKTQPELHDFFMDSVATVAEKMKILYPDFFMQQVWGNIHNLEGQAHTLHIHSNSIWSSVFNVHCLPPNDSTWIHRGDDGAETNSQSLQHVLVKKPPKDNSKFHQLCEQIFHEPGDFLIFRSNVPHSVEPFKKTFPADYRLSLSANFWHYEVGNRDFGTYLRVDPNYENPNYKKDYKSHEMGDDI
jgi:hypothetical protein